MGNKNLLISISGARGIIGAEDGLTPETALKLAAAFGSYRRNGKIVLGTDTRPSRIIIKSAVISGLAGCGLDVIDIGICPTPTVELAVKDFKAAGGIIITASHNPLEWNALKFLNSKGMFLSPAEGKRLLEIYRSNNYAYKPFNKLGNIINDNYIPMHINKILKLQDVKIAEIKKRKFRVALDCINGAGALLSPKLLKELGCRVIPVNCEPNGYFAHKPEPIPKNLKQLSESVKRNKCDIGFAHDPDADRLAIVDENGVPIGEEYTLAFAVDYILSLHKGNVAVNLSTSRIIDDIASRYSEKVYRTAVGEINVSLKLRRIKGVIGGEGNGGVIYPPLLYGRDGAVGIALILSYLSKNKRSVSETVDNLPRYIMIKDKEQVDKFNIRKLAKKLGKEFPDAKINYTDGIKLDFKDSWVHIRASNTEPIVRIITEALSQKRSLYLRNVIKSLISR